MIKILAIDDNQNNLVTLTALFSNAFPDALIITALSGREGIEKALSESPDVILLDLVMPIMDGIETCKRLKENNFLKWIPVIMITAIKTDSKTRIKALETGVEAFLSKPIDEAELAAQVSSMIRLKQSRDQIRLEKIQLEALVKQRTKILESELKERKKAEDALQQSEELLRNLYNDAPVGLYRTTVDGKILLANRAIYEMLGFSTFGQFSAKNLEECGFEPTYRRDQFSEQIEKNGEVRDLEAKWVCSNGEVIVVRENAKVIYDSDGKPLYFDGTVEDITERKKLEEKFQLSEEKYRTMIEQSNDMIWTLDGDGALTYFNQQCEEITGHRFKDWEGKSFAPLIVEEELSSIFDIFHRVMKGESLHYEVHVQGANDRIVLLSVNTAPILKAGEIIGTASFGRDITDIRKAEEQLRATRDYLENLLDYANAAIIVWDPDTTITRFNHAFEHLTGYRSGEMIGKKLELLFPESTKSESMKKINLTLKGEYWESVEIPILCKNGNIRTLLSNSANIHATDGTTLQAVIVQGIDITDRIKQDQIQKALYNISQAGIAAESLELFMAEIQKELNTIIDTTNFYIAFYDESTDTISMPFMADQKDRFTTYPANKTMTKYMMESHKPLLATKDDMLALQKSGHIDIHGTLSEIWLGAPLKSHGIVTGALVVQSYEDPNAYGKPEISILEFFSVQISMSIERKKAEEEIKVALEKAQEYDRLKSAFLATISHELRTPLNAVIGFSQLIDMETPQDEVVMMTELIQKSGQHLLSIIEDMFDVTLIESGQVSLNEEEFFILPFMENIHRMLKIELGKANKEEIEIVFQGVPENRDFLINTDKFKLTQILMNLLKNALKFTPAGRIEYGYKPEIRDGESVLQFFVKDTGIGIPEEARGIIFDVFRQVDDSHTRQYGGTGISLSVAKKLTEMLGGQIWVDSKEGEGSTFYFTVPYQEGKEAIRPAESFVVSSQKELSFPGKTILIAEDDESNFEYLQIVLKKLQLIILWAKNGLEAIELSKSNPQIDLVLMDIKMPNMSGYKATKQIKKTRPDLPIIAQTAYALYGDKENSKEAGCDDYITKPIQKEHLIKILEKHLAARKDLIA
ncbi:MAG: PAS domain S-box protein [Bacteroidota bacterium]